jgi:hypothetical protein
VAHIPDFGDAPTSPYEPLHDRDDQPCLIDVTDFNEILPIYSHKWGMKMPKISALQTVPLLRYLNYNGGSIG